MNRNRKFSKAWPTMALPLAAFLGLMSIAATIDIYMQPELTGTTDTSGSDVLAVFKSGGGSGSGRKIKLGNLVPKPADAGMAKEIWISDREVGDGGDGLGGDGTQRNPFNGGTPAKFDAILVALENTTNVTAHIGPGVFLTNGNLPSTGWHANSGWKILGSGRDATTLKQNAIVDNSNFGVIYTPKGDVDVGDLTIDCNFPTLSATIPSSTNKNIYGIGIGGGKIHNVRCINSGGTFETFALNISRFPGTGTASQRLSIIDDSLIEQCGNNVTGFTIQSSSVAANGDTVPDGNTAIIRNCYFDGSSATLTQGFQINGFKHAIVEGNTAINCTSGYYWDTLPIGTLEIRNNYFSAHTTPIALVGGYTMDRAFIRSNTLATTADVSPRVRTDSATNAVIDGNFFLVGASDFNAPIQTNGTATANDIMNNRFPAGLTIGSGNAIDGRRWNNRGFNGSIIAAIADNFSPSVATAPKVARADGASGADQTCTNATRTTFDFTTPTFDPGGLMNATTDRCTAPAAGSMILSFTAYFSSITSAGTLQVEISKNGTPLKYKVISNPNAQTYSVDVVDRPSAADYYTFTVFNSTGASATLSRAAASTFVNAQFIPD